MAFSSPAFVFAFLPIVFLLHCVIRNQKCKNALLIAASLLFYSAGSLVHLPLLLAVAAVNFLAGLLFQRRALHKRLVLILTLLLNLGALVVFKYLDFFTDSVNSLFGLSIPLAGLALPIGISFFTFQGLSYTLDVYRDEESGTRSFWELLLYISFFPQLIAGPIVKYHDVAGQIRSRSASAQDMAEGCRRFIVGLSKKLLLADILAVAVDAVYAEGALGDARLSLIAGVCYAMQIYFDFSGYSDMAIGMGRMFGFHFLENFDHPYTASTIREFWRRWHISLSSWFREYLYIPLGGNRRGTARTCLNVMLVFFLTGLWHGASWTFVLWGIWHGVWSVLERVTPLNKLSGTVIGRIYTLILVVLGFMLFRADSIGQALSMIGSLFTGYGASLDATLLLREVMTWKVVAAAAVGLLLCTGLQRRLTVWATGKPPMQAAAYVSALALFALCLLRLASASFNPFIYFQF
ncbi:MAG: MBOAT family protein [Oscillospiraceae bacterium]|nr:MBOAT family protein [Oscillospiraceae bacterium]